MVKETRHVFDLKDITAIRLHCEHCGRDAVQSIARTDVSKQCPFCHQDWEADYTGGNRGDNWQIVRAMQRLLKTESPSMTLRFEIETEADGQ